MPLSTNQFILMVIGVIIIACIVYAIRISIARTNMDNIGYKSEISQERKILQENNIFQQEEIHKNIITE